ncbi:MAG: hypothetical protein GH151_12165 [Bacteroidetes bacterium]|nr:hypothetical protein [Bacteroidota bacterium]
MQWTDSELFMEIDFFVILGIIFFSSLCRATLQGYFLPKGGSILIGHAIAGLWTTTVIKYYVFSLPIVFMAILLGNYLNRKFRRESFTKYIYTILIILGIWLIVNSLKIT